ncbi:MAG: hypothetical protein ABH871_02410 [Pseudomonadota bacterium]
MKPFNRYLKYIVFTMAGIVAISIAIFAYAQQSDLPEGWEEPAAPLPPGAVKLEEVGKPSTTTPAASVPAEAAPAEALPDEMGPSEPTPSDTGVYDKPQKYPGSQISTIPPVTGPHAGTPAAGTYGSAPAAAPSGVSSDLPAGWEEPAAPLPPGAVKLEEVGSRPAAPAAVPESAAEPSAPAKTKVKVDEREEVGADNGEGEESFQKPSRWDNY